MQNKSFSFYSSKCWDNAESELLPSWANCVGNILSLSISFYFVSFLIFFLNWALTIPCFTTLLFNCCICVYDVFLCAFFLINCTVCLAAVFPVCYRCSKINGTILQEACSEFNCTKYQHYMSIFFLIAGNVARSYFFSKWLNIISSL